MKNKLIELCVDVTCVYALIMQGILNQPSNLTHSIISLWTFAMVLLAVLVTLMNVLFENVMKSFKENNSAEKYEELKKRYKHPSVYTRLSDITLLILLLFSNLHFLLYTWIYVMVGIHIFRDNIREMDNV